MSKKGVDVSHNNGNVDWQAVKNAGFGDFAIIRMGYGGNYTNQDDTQFINNVNKCENMGIPYGVYFYSYALNVNSAKSEIEHAKRLLKKVGKNFKYGVWFDMEDADGYKQEHGMPSNSTLVDICYTFCESIENAGYYVGIYASLSWLNNQLNDSKLDRFDKWVAQWNKKGCTYQKAYSIWQNTSDQIIGGKRFDANVLIRDFATSSQNSNSTSKKSNEQIADEVIQGKWGNGDDRKNRLNNAGYDYQAIQSIVNQKLETNTSKKSNEVIANEVIAGKWGNGNDRKKRLNAAGYDYNAIQNIVNAKLGSTQTSYYKKYTGSSVSLVDALKSIGVDSSLSNRKKIAKSNGISNYSGTASQNTKLLNLLKQGKLKK